jgi:hypothetical protein
MAIAFRRLGFKILYSGWSSDKEWLEQNRQFFDNYCVSTPDGKSTELDFHGTRVINNKLKLYWLVNEGLKQAASISPDAYVLRLRSDVAIDPGSLLISYGKIKDPDQTIVIEYGDREQVAYIPDFMMAGTVNNLSKLYSHLVDINTGGNPYHISSHLEHGIALVKFVNEGVFRHVYCMTRQNYESVVWRGVPRYLECRTSGIAPNLLFDCALVYPEGLTPERILRQQ